MDNIKNAAFVKGFCKMANDGWLLGFHERNGGNLSYRIKDDEIKSVWKGLDFSGEWMPIGADVPTLKNEFFLVTGSGKYFQNVLDDPENNIAIVEVDDSGKNYRICWGLKSGGRPTSELPSHLMNHAVKKELTGGKHRVIYHAHPVNIIALTFILPLEDKVFTREIWEMMTECPVIFPDGMGVIPWMVPGGMDIAIETSNLMKKYDVAVWAHHGMFCSGEDFDSTFGLMHTVEKAADILIKVLSVTPNKLQTITPQNFRDLARDFGFTVSEEFLYDK